MGMLDIFRRKAPIEQRDHTLKELTPELEALLTGGPTASGVKINERNALTITAVYAAVSVISESVAQLPMSLFRRLDDGGKVLASEEPLFGILRNRPNPEMTPFEFWQFILACTLISGNGYAQIQRNNAGAIANLWPLRADRILITRVKTGPRAGELFYTLNSGSLEEKQGSRGFFQDEILHLRGLSRDGVYGVGPISEARESLGLTKAMEQFDARYFGNGAMPSVILVHPQKLTPENRKNILDAWNEAHQGTRKAFKPSIASGGADVKVIGFNPEDSQLLESRKFQISEVARIFKLPPHKLGDLERATFSNVEQQELNFLQQTLQPWITRIEQVIWRDLIAPDPSLFAEFQIDTILRADLESRNASFVAGLTNGWFNQDDVRAMMNLNPIPDGQGKTYYRPLNLTPLAAPTPTPPDVSSTRSTVQPEHRSPATEERSLHLAAVAHRPLFATVAKELLDIEVPAVRSAFDTEDPVTAIGSFYDSHTTLVEGQIRAAVEIYAEEVRKLAAGGMGDPNIDLLVAKYVQAAAVRWVSASRGQVFKLIKDNDPDNARQAVSARMENWLDNRPARFALRETVQASGAVAKETFQALGFKKIRWRTRGGGPSELDGKEVLIGQNFVERGEEIGGVNANTGISHPPFGQGDESIIEPVVE